MDTGDLVHIPIPTTDRQVVATLIDGRPMVSLRHACEAIGLNYTTQAEKLGRRSWASVVPLKGTATDGKAYVMSMIDRRTFVMWLATIDTNRVSDNARPIVEAFQAEAADALDAYFAGEAAPGNRPTTIDGIRAMLDQIEAAQRDAEIATRKADAARQIAERSEARLDGIEGRHDWFSGLGYVKAHGLPSYEKFVRQLGKCAAMIARTHDIAPVPVQHAHYGTVNSFPAWIWDLAADGLTGDES